MDPGHVWHMEVMSPAVDQVLRSLGCQEATRSLIPLTWSEVTRFFQQEVLR